MKHESGITDYLKSSTIIFIDGIPTIDHEFDYPYKIARIDQLTRKIAQSKHPLFKTIRNRSGDKGIQASKIGGEFRMHLRAFSTDITKHYCKHKFGPYFTLFLKYAARLKHAIEPFNYSHDLIEINTLIEEIRNEAHQSDFNKLYEKTDRSARKNCQSLIEYVRGLFNFYSKLLVVRIDLGYSKKLRASPGREISPIDVQRDRDKFIRHIRRKFPSLAGYIWKLEYGLSKSYHIHFMIFFDGHKVMQDIVIGNLLGELWENNITRGIGTFWNCNGTKKRYRKLGTLGIGAISHDDIELRKNLENAASYLAKADYYVRLDEPDLGKTLGKGLSPRKPSSRRGRRRKQRQTAQTLTCANQPVFSASQ